MKTTTTPINRSLIAAAFLVAATPFASQAALQVNYPNGNECEPLIAGQHIEAGEVCVNVQGTNLAVTYNMFGDWELLEAHLWAGMDLLEMPANKKGNPKIGNFPYVTGDITGAKNYTFYVPLADLSTDLCGKIALLAGHAAVGLDDDGDGVYEETQTGWIDGEQIIDKGSWAMFSSVDFTCPVDTAVFLVEETCGTETAYAKSYAGTPLATSTTFIDLGITSSRWGWQITVDDGADFSAPIYAGAGQNDITKGTEVGVLEVSYVGGVLTVTYMMDAGFSMEELHLNVSEDDLLSIAPGSYTVVEEDLGDGNELQSTFEFRGLTAASMNVVAHAVVEICE